ncbi:MAG: Maf family protein [Myxococcales bacterium]|nr:Maf family protein [Myxococcota bacterium]MDW8280139.1 Maf family protein [Myxococcales bacterium]
MQADAPVVVLASASPRRIEMLRQAGVPHLVYPADIDETPRPGERPEELVVRISRAKAEAVAPRQPTLPVLAADTVVVVAGSTLGKPPHEGAARQMLLLLSGTTHRVLTGYHLRVPRPGGQVEVRERVVETEVEVRPLREADLAAYLATEEWRGKAGAYAIQGRFRCFVRAVHGSHDSVIGLPLCRVLEDLLEAGVLPAGWPAWSP